MHTALIVLLTSIGITSFFLGAVASKQPELEPESVAKLFAASLFCGGVAIHIGLSGH